MVDLASDVPSIQRFFRHEDDEDDAREREVYRYYRPLEDLYSSSSVNPSTPTSTHSSDAPQPQITRFLPSPDRALTAFAQLGALRLNCRRVLISLLDRHYQYVIAEATQTLSLPKKTVDDKRDDLCFGVSQYARLSTACCEYTAGLVPLIPGGRDTLPPSKVLLIPDLTLDERFKTEPYVVGKPWGRFYIGAPIVSPSGHTIGAYCVLDDKARDGLSDVETDFVRDMASTVMSHLEMVRTKTELRRSRYMVAGLGNFIAGNANSQNWWDSLEKAPDDDHHVKHESLSSVSGSETISHSSPSQAVPEVIVTDMPVEHEKFYTPPQVPHSTADTNPSKGVKHGSPPGRHPRPSLNNPKRSAIPPGGESFSSDVRDTFSRASNIVREAVEVDGAIIFDAAISTFGGLVRRPHEPILAAVNSGLLSGASSKASSAVDSSCASGKSTPRWDVPEEANEATCPILGSSIVTKEGCDRPEVDAPRPLPEHVLRSLLARYPKGKIWNFNKDNIQPDGINDVQSLATMGSDHPVNRKGRRWRDRKLIQLLFPGVRSLAFIGMWDCNRERWYAGSILWTCSATRIMSPEVELNYLIAFGQTIMSEVAASEVRQADRAKGAFITSISHELRTPLHGILGSADCLQSTAMDAFQSGLVQTIDTCGKTLLETFDNLLSFAKINYVTNIRGKKTSAANMSDSVKQGAMGHNESVVLGTLVEEVVETVFAGQEYLRTGSKSPPESDIGGLVTGIAPTASGRGFFKGGPSGLEAINVSVTYLNPGSSRWNVQTQPGAWRRIVLNLVGNAIKYTDRGFINIDLAATTDPQDDSRTDITLSVSDSGKGMSEDFAAGKLFAPFVQEDPLSPGTGLGLSIVKQIVEALNGRIILSSKKDEGTKFIITASLPRGMSSPQASLVNRVLENCNNLQLNTLTDVPQSHGMNDAIWTFASVYQTCFGLPPEAADKDRHQQLYVSSEKYIRAHAGNLPLLFQKADRKTRSALVVICKDSKSARAFKRLSVAADYFPIVCCISQPIGPNKVACALEPFMDYLAKSEKAKSSPSSHQRARSRVFPADSVRSERASTRDKASPFADQSPLESPQDSGHASYDMPFLRYTPSPKPDKSIDTVISPVPSERRSLARSLDESSPDIPLRGDLQSTSPLKDDSASTLGASSTETATAPLAISAPILDSAPRASVLLVDDNAVNLRLLSAFVQKQKRTFNLAEDGAQAVERYRSAVPSVVAESLKLSKDFVAYDIVFMDLNMPVLGGLEATRRIRGFEREIGLKPAKIIALTGMGTEDAQKEAFASGVDMFLTKPVRLKEIAALLDDSRGG